MTDFNDSLVGYPVAMFNLWLDSVNVKLPSENFCTNIRKKWKLKNLLEVINEHLFWVLCLFSFKSVSLNKHYTKMPLVNLQNELLV